MDRGIAIASRGLTKRYGQLTALSGADLEIPKATIHALVGQNGAGKSTFLNMVAGRIRPTDGALRVSGELVQFSSPRDGRAAGVVGIYQELSIVPEMTAVENVFLGGMPTQFGKVKDAEMVGKFFKLTNRLGVSINPQDKAGHLSIADQQILEIMRAVQFGARTILLDEPTAALAPAEREALFALMRDLRAQGHTLLLVSHNLDEVLDIADAVTVFRNGHLISTRLTENWSKSALVTEMLGKSVDSLYKRRVASAPLINAPVLLEVSNLCVPGAVQDISLTLRRGEILGLGGLVGSGRSTVLRSIAGAEPAASGAMQVGGNSKRWPRTVCEARSYRIGIVPEDRKLQGLFLQMKTSENIVVTDLKSCSRFGFISRLEIEKNAASAGKHFNLDRGRSGHVVSTLSGGNQQKALLSRWWHDRPDILLIDEPTRGIDVGAKAEILASLRAMANEGIGIIMVSSELEELVAVSDRVSVLSQGCMAGEIERDDISVTAILNHTFHVEEAHV